MIVRALAYFADATTQVIANEIETGPDDWVITQHHAGSASRGVCVWIANGWAFCHLETPTGVRLSNAGPHNSARLWLAWRRVCERRLEAIADAGAKAIDGELARPIPSKPIRLS